MEPHNLELIEMPYFDTSGIMYKAYCSCGKYVSAKTPSKLDAEKMWLNHMVAKTQNDV